MGKLILFLIFTISIQQNTITNLYGNWKLMNVQTSAETLYPTENFNLSITEKEVTFNRGPNKCWQIDFKLSENEIQIGSGSCTEIAEHDPICEILDYSGKYQIQDSTLTIVNNQGTFILIKQK